LKKILVLVLVIMTMLSCSLPVKQQSATPAPTTIAKVTSSHAAFNTTAVSPTDVPTIEASPTDVPTVEASPTDVPTAYIALVDTPTVVNTPDDPPAAQPPQQFSSGEATYTFGTMDGFQYLWDYTPGTEKKTPQIRHDAQSTGDGITRKFDIGVNKGEFGVVTGISVTIGSMTYGPCALITLTPGYYKGVTITSGRFEVYYLPDSTPRDPSGWSHVLADQAQDKEHTLYFMDEKHTIPCPSKTMSDIPLVYSSLLLPFAP
jgi:hypothetical protein